MHTSIFLTISNVVEKHNDRFKVTRNVCGDTSVGPLIKCITTVQLLACGYSADAINDYVRIGEGTILEVVQKIHKSHD